MSRERAVVSSILHKVLTKVPFILRQPLPLLWGQPSLFGPWLFLPVPVFQSKSTFWAILTLKGKALLLMCKRYYKGADSGSQWQQRPRSCKEVLLSAHQFYRKGTYPNGSAIPSLKVSEPYMTRQEGGRVGVDASQGFST